jgi:predicted N-acetyltransferase YhbS
MSTQLRLATPDDYDRILQHIDAGFSFEPGTFLSRYPNHWRPEMMDWSHMHLATEDGKIAAFVRVFPLDVVQDGARFRVGGIGAVSTAPWARGRGHMTKLLEWTNLAMREEGFALAILDGDRHRYRTFGYESAGRSYNVTVNARGLKRLGIPEVEPIRYTGQPGILEAMTRLYDAGPYRRIRPTEETPWLYQASDLPVWASGEDGNDAHFGYLMLYNNTIAEWGGHLATVLGLVRALQAQGSPSLVFRFPDPAHIPAIFTDLMGFWSIAPSTSIQVLDAAAVLKAYEAAPSTDDASLPDVTELKRLEATAQSRALFGGLNSGAFNFFLPRSERV